jgi:hypothetical protein
MSLRPFHNTFSWADNDGHRKLAKVPDQQQDFLPFSGGRKLSKGKMVQLYNVTREYY